MTREGKMSQSHDVKYEDALKRLEKIVEELERPDLELEARLKKFEEGTRLARALLKKLDQAKKHVQVLVETRMGEAGLEPFDEDAKQRGNEDDAKDDEEPPF